MIFVALCVFLFSLYIYKKTSMDESVKVFAKAVPGPALWPIIGNLPSFLKADYRSTGVLQDNWEKYGNRFRLMIVNKPLLVTSDVRDIEIILAKTSLKADVYDLVKPFLGNCLLLNSADIAKKKRKIIIPTFHTEVLTNYFPILEKYIKTFLAKMNNKNNSLNIAELGQLFTLDVLTETSMGVEVNAMDNADSDFVIAFKRLLDCWEVKFRKLLYHSNFIYFNCSNVGKTEIKICGILEKFCGDIITARRKLVESNEVFIEGKRISLLDALLTAEDEDGTKLSDETISYEVRQILIAGHDTVSATLSFLTYEVAKRLDIQEKIYEEQLQIFGQNHEKIANVNEVHEMKYLEMVIKESLRCYTTAPIIGRKATEDIQFDGFILPKGSDVYINLFNMGKNPEIFPDPMKFDPERFNSDSTAYKNRSPYAFIPFSYGARNCIGHTFAMWELKSLFSSIIRNYKISLLDDHELEFVFGVMIKPKNGLYINIEKR